MSLMTELKRRNVFRVGVAYAIVAWLLIEVAHTAFPTLQLPDWTTTLVTVLMIMGFPVALVIAWAFELTPEGIKRESAVDRTESITHVTGRKLDFAIIGLLVIAVAYFALDKFVLEAEPEQASVVREKSIAVLLFDNLSGDAATQPFTKGIHDDILTQLSKISALKVIARTLVLHDRGARDHLEFSDFRELGENFIVDAIGEVGVFRVGADVGERQHGNRLLSHNGCLLRLGFQHKFIHGEVNNGDGQDTDDDEVQLSTCRVADRLRAINLGFSLDPLRRQLERPGQDQREWEAQDYQKGDDLHDPFGRAKGWQNHGRHFYQQPGHDRVGHTYPEDVAALEFGDQ